MLSCPNENTQEWKDILAEANGNRRKALELWTDRGYNQNENLNVEVSNDNFADQRQGQPDLTDPAKDNDFSKLIENIKLDLARKLAILKQKKIKDQTAKEKRLERLIKNIEAAEGAESINMFVNDAYENSIRVRNYFADILKNKKNLDLEDPEVRKTTIQKLTAIAEFANGYSILDEIRKEDVYEFFNINVDENTPADKLTPQEKLSIAFTIRDNLKTKHITEGIPLMADFLLGYRSVDEDKNQAEIDALRIRVQDIINNPNIVDEKKKKRIAELEDRIANFQSFSLEKKELIRVLTMANSDESITSYLFDPLISSEDAALGLFAKAIKSQMEDARQKDIKNIEEISDKLEAYADTVTASRDNKALFNDGIYEIVTETYLDKNNELKEVKKAAFVEKYDNSTFKRNRAQFFESIGEKPLPTDPENPTPQEIQRLKAYNRKVAMWFSENTEPLPEEERQKIIEAKERQRDDGIITNDEYNQWLASVVKQTITGDIIYMKELTRPAKKYINNKWKALYDQNDVPKNPKGVYHQYLVDRYLKAQEKLPESQRKGYILPSIEKTDLERAIENGLKDVVGTNLKEMFSIQAYEQQFGLANLSENTAKFLPVYYTQPIDINDVSLDLAKSVAMFEAMANRYEALNEIYSEITLFKTIIGKRKISETNSKGQPIIDAFAKKQGISEYIKKNGETYSELHLNAFIDMVIYGEMQKAEEVLGISLGKVTNTISGFSALSTIAIDLLKGLANNLQGNIQLIIEANSGEFFSTGNLAKGKAFYSKYLPGVLSDFGKPVAKSFLGRLVDKYDPMQGTYKDQYGKNVSASVAAKLFRTDTLFFNQQFGEHEIQVSCMLALMDNTKVIDNATGEEINLLEAYERYGVDKVEENTDFTETKRKNLQNRIHALSKRMHGVYNEFDRATIQKYALGRLLLMYRKHVVPGYKRRFKGLSYDQELGSYTEGYYVTFINTFVRDLRDYKFNIMNNWSTYSPFEKAQIKRVIAEITIILAAWTLIYVLKGMADDDDDLKKNYMFNFMLYETIRMRSETASYINPYDAYRVVRSPSAVTGTLERAIKFIDQFFLTWDPDKLKFKRKTGVWDKGDNKSWAYFLKLMGYTGYNLTPEEAVESFEGTLNK